MGAHYTQQNMVSVVSTVTILSGSNFLNSKKVQCINTYSRAAIRSIFIPNPSPKCKIEVQNNHSMMCFKNVPDVFLHSCGNLWLAFPHELSPCRNVASSYFPTNSVATCRTLWEIWHNMWDTGLLLEFCRHALALFESGIKRVVSSIRV